MDAARRLPGAIKAAAVMLGIVGVGSLVAAAFCAYMVFSASGMLASLVQIILGAIGAIAMVGGVGALATLPRIVKGTGRTGATVFAAIILALALFMAFWLTTSLLESAELQDYPTGGVFWAAYAALIALSATTSLILLWGPGTAREFMFPTRRL